MSSLVFPPSSSIAAFPRQSLHSVSISLMYPAKRRRAIKVASDSVVRQTTRRKPKKDSKQDRHGSRYLSQPGSRLSCQRPEACKNRVHVRCAVESLTSMSTRARRLTDATLTRNRCPSYPSLVSKTGPSHAASALHLPAENRPSVPKVDNLPRRGFCRVAQPNHSTWACYTDRASRH